MNNSGSDLFLGEVADKFVGLILCDIGNSCMLIHVFMILVYFFHEMLIAFNKIREQLTVDSNNEHFRL
jgi:hypothetical protein